MAIFNLQVPDSRDPNLPNIRPIESIPPNQSGKTFFDTLGSSISEAVNVVDTAIKGGIKDKAYEQVDPLRDQFTAGLQQVKKQLDNDQSAVPAPVQTVAGATTGKSLLDANAMADEDDLPPGLESGLDKIRQLSAAKAAGSVKLNDTQYAMDTLSVAKGLRAQYGTGYRDYIDSEVSKASGLPVANSYYQNLMLDINRQLTQKAQNKDDIGALMMKNLDAPGIPAELNNRRSGTPKMPDGDVLQTIGDWQHLQTQYKIDADKRGASTAAISDKADDVEKKASVNFSNEVNLGLKSITSQAGVPTAGALMQYITDYTLGRHPEATQPQIDQRIAQLHALTQQQRNALWSRGHEVGPDGESIASTLGKERFSKLVDDAMYPMDTFKTFATDKDTGPAVMLAHQNDAILQQDKNNILINNATGPAARQFEAVRSILGDGQFPEYMKSVAAGGFADPLATLYTQEALGSLVPATDARGQPLPPRTMLDSIQHAKDVNVPENSEYYGKTIKRVEDITNPNLPLTAKDKIIQYAFSPKNVSMLDELNKDYRDPKTGNWVPGQYAAFNILSAPKITDAVKETSKVKPDNYKMYQDTLEQQFGKLYRSDLNQLNGVLNVLPTDPSGRPISGNKQPLAHFSYNSGDNTFGLVDKDNRPITHENLDVSMMGAHNYSRFTSMLDTLDNVNSGLKNMAYVYKNNPAGEMDPSERTLRLLQTAVRGKFGYNDNAGIEGATPEMMKAVIKSQAPEMTQQDLANSVLKFSNEGRAQGPSVAQFVSNPTGDPLPKRVPGNVVGPNESIIGSKSDEVPAGMTVEDFIKELKRTGRY